MRHPLLLTATLLLLAGSSAIPTDARKTKVPTAAARRLPTTATRESFTVDSTAQRPGPLLADIAFTRFDKPVESRQETFLVSNASTSTLISLTLRIDYYLTGGNKIHSRTETIECNIPAGETRQVTIRSFDRQQTYRYTGSRVPPRRAATPFDVHLTPVRLTFLLPR